MQQIRFWLGPCQTPLKSSPPAERPLQEMARLQRTTSRGNDDDDATVVDCQVITQT